MTVATPDHELLDRWRTGDKVAGNELFRRHFVSIRRFFRNKVRAEDGEDLIQRTFAACVESRDRFRGDSSFRTFLFSVARRQLYKYLRERSYREARVDPDFTVSSIHALGETPSRLLVAAEQQALVLEALQRVPVEYQVMLELFYWEQLKGPEIAAVFEISPVTVRTRLHRARRALEEELNKLVTLVQTPGSSQTPIDLETSVRALQEKL